METKQSATPSRGLIVLFDGLLLILALFTAVPDCMAAGLSISMGGAKASPGTANVEVPIIVGDTTGLGVVSADLQVTYDSTRLTYASTAVTGTLAEGWGKPPVNANTLGTLRIAMYGVESLSGSGTLLKLFFNVKPEALWGQSTTQLVRATFNDGTSVTSSTASGTFTVRGPFLYENILSNSAISEGRVVIGRSQFDMNDLQPYGYYREDKVIVSDLFSGEQLDLGTIPYAASPKMEGDHVIYLRGQQLYYRQLSLTQSPAPVLSKSQSAKTQSKKAAPESSASSAALTAGSEIAVSDVFSPRSYDISVSPDNSMVNIIWYLYSDVPASPSPFNKKGIYLTQIDPGSLQLTTHKLLLFSKSCGVPAQSCSDFNYGADHIFPRIDKNKATWHMYANPLDQFWLTGSDVFTCNLDIALAAQLPPGSKGELCQGSALNRITANAHASLPSISADSDVITWIQYVSVDHYDIYYRQGNSAPVQVTRMNGAPVRNSYPNVSGTLIAWQAGGATHPNQAFGTIMACDASLSGAGLGGCALSDTKFNLGIGMNPSVSDGLVSFMKYGSYNSQTSWWYLYNVGIWPPIAG